MRGQCHPVGTEYLYTATIAVMIDYLIERGSDGYPTQNLGRLGLFHSA